MPGSSSVGSSYFFVGAAGVAGRDGPVDAGLMGESTFCTSVLALINAAFMSSGIIGRHFTSPASVR